MKIGLVRHFKVKKERPGGFLLTGAELTDWLDKYDEADVEPTDVDLGTTQWTKCFCSDMERAIETAKEIYAGDLIINEDLKKIQLPKYALIWKGRLPIIVWGIITKFILGTKHKSVIENNKAVQQRVNLVLDEIIAHGEDVLIVSHATLMMKLRKEIVRRGYQGPRFKPYPKNALLYVYENTDSKIR